MSSNASTPVYTVRLRGISSDLQQLGPEISAHDLGKLGAAQVITLLKEFASIDPVRLVEADPHVLLTGARGSFSAKPHQGRLLLQSTGVINASYIELAPEEVPSWLDDAQDVMDSLIRLRTETGILEEQRRLISEELRTTAQRVNLFEKVKIPECRENIRTIKIYLGDEQTAAVARGKLAKKRTVATDIASEAEGQS